MSHVQYDLSTKCSVLSSGEQDVVLTLASAFIPDSFLLRRSKLCCSSSSFLGGRVCSPTSEDFCLMHVHSKGWSSLSSSFYSNNCIYTLFFKKKKKKPNWFFKWKSVWMCAAVSISSLRNYLPVYQNSSLFCSSSQASTQALALAGADYVTGGLHVFLLLLTLQSSWLLMHQSNCMLLAEFLDHHILKSTYLMSIISIYEVNLQDAWLLSSRSSFKSDVRSACGTFNFTFILLDSVTLT